jgi:hypothetical protein
MSYKRNQIEEAIASMFEPKSKTLASQLRTRMKRLLELDRARGRRLRSHDTEEANFAFFSAEAPGTGADILFSEYEAFALLNGLRILEHGWTQGFAVSVMRRVRVELEREHARILRQDSNTFFDPEAIRQKTRAGDMVIDNTDPVYLTLASKTQRADGNNPTPEPAVFRGDEAFRKLLRQGAASSVTIFELATPAHNFRNELMRTEPKRRGRG